MFLNVSYLKVVWCATELTAGSIGMARLYREVAYVLNNMFLLSGRNQPLEATFLRGIESFRKAKKFPRRKSQKIKNNLAIIKVSGGKLTLFILELDSSISSKLVFLEVQ